MTVRSLLFVAAGALALGLAGGVQLQSWRLGVQLADLRTESAAALRRQAEANATAMAEQQAARLALEGKLQVADKKHQKEMSDAHAENDRLRAAVRAGTVRLSVRTTGQSCATAGDVPAAAGARGVDDAVGRAEIYPADADALVGIAGDADACAVTLSGLQDWARAVTAPR